jgi:hypothetical protein
MVSTSLEKIQEDEPEILIYAHQKRLYFDKLPLDAEVRVYNLAGQLLHQNRPQAAQFEVALPEGGRQIWMVRVLSAQGVVNRKVID